ncbi:MAG: DUF6165 family protein, partial [Pseudomonadota bacterium]
PLLVPVSVGELIDKITILRIKKSKADDKQKLVNIEHELSQLEEVWNQSSYSKTDISALTQSLTEVNETLWKIEDDIRAKEAVSEFDDIFVQLARSVYQQNDLRAALKKEINTITGSTLVEEKLYQEY